MHPMVAVVRVFCHRRDPVMPSDGKPAGRSPISGDPQIT
jgi:hypothetical protein